MHEYVYAVLLSVSFIPHEASVHGVSVFTYSAVNMFTAAFSYAALVVCARSYACACACACAPKRSVHGCTLRVVHYAFHVVQI